MNENDSEFLTIKTHLFYSEIRRLSLVIANSFEKSLVDNVKLNRIKRLLSFISGDQ